MIMPTITLIPKSTISSSLWIGGVKTFYEIEMCKSLCVTSLDVSFQILTWNVKLHWLHFSSASMEGFSESQFANRDKDSFWVEMLKSVPNCTDWEDIRAGNQRKHTFQHQNHPYTRQHTFQFWFTTEIRKNNVSITQRSRCKRLKIFVVCSADPALFLEKRWLLENAFVEIKIKFFGFISCNNLNADLFQRNQTN